MQPKSSQEIMPPKWRRSALPPLLLAASLTGCATYSPIVIEPMRPAPDPDLMVPPSRDSYSQSVQRLLQSWRERLTPTPPGSEAGSTGPAPLKE